VLIKFLKPHHMHLVQRHGPLLLMFCGLCVLVITATSCAKMAKQIQMPFGMWTHAGPRNHVSDWGTYLLRRMGQYWEGTSQLTVKYSLRQLFARRQQRCGRSLSVLEHSNSSKKSFDSIFSIRFGNLINLQLVH